MLLTEAYLVMILREMTAPTRPEMMMATPPTTPVNQLRPNDIHSFDRPASSLTLMTAPSLGRG